MYTLFNDQLPSTRGGINLPQLDFVIRGLDQEVQKIIAYYQKNPQAVSSDHLLVKVIQSLSVPFGTDVNIYRDRVEEQALDLAMHFKLTSVLNRGNVFNGVFYGSGTMEAIIAASSDFDAEEATKNWQTLEPIRVIRHARTSLYFDPIRPTLIDGEEGMAVILVDIPMLAVQYRAWRKDPTSYSRDESPRSIMQFLCTYPLPKMIGSHVNIAIFNRLAAWRDAIVPTDQNATFPFFVANWYRRLDEQLLKLNEMLDRTRGDFLQVLTNIPGVTTDSFLEAIRLPKILATRYVQWAFTLSRLPVVKFLLQQADQNSIQRNGVYVNIIRRELREMRNDRALQYAMSTQDYERLERQINGMINAYT